MKYDYIFKNITMFILGIKQIESPIFKLKRPLLKVRHELHVVYKTRHKHLKFFTEQTDNIK